MQLMNANHPALSVILVNYRTGKLLDDCIRSIYAETKHLPIEIIVVDNHSQDESKSLITGTYPNVKWIQLDYNSGFARANNIGIQSGLADTVLLLNTDTIIKEGAIEKVFDLFGSDQEYAACGVQLLNEDGSHQISGAHVMTGGLNTLLALPYLGRLVRFLGYRAGAKKPSIDMVARKTDVDWIIGAFLMARMDTIRKAGLLDEDFFMYSEEMEWCARLKKQGKLCLYGDPKVIHLGGGSSKQVFQSAAWNNEKNLCNKRGKQVIVSNLLRIRKEFGIFWMLFINLFYLINIPVFIICLATDRMLNGSEARFEFADLKGYISNVIFLQCFVPRIIGGKPYFYKVI